MILRCIVHLLAARKAFLLQLPFPLFLWLHQHMNADIKFMPGASDAEANSTLSDERKPSYVHALQGAGTLERLRAEAFTQINSVWTSAEHGQQYFSLGLRGMGAIMSLIHAYSAFLVTQAQAHPEKTDEEIAQQMHWSTAEMLDALRMASMAGMRDDSSAEACLLLMEQLRAAGILLKQRISQENAEANGGEDAFIWRMPIMENALHNYCSEWLRRSAWRRKATAS